MSNFQKDLVAFNIMYKMPYNMAPTLDIGQPLLKRLTDFKSILTKELAEIDTVWNKAACFLSGELYSPPDGSPAYAMTELEVLTDLADLFGDIQVFCGSEMAKFGLPLDNILSIIMDSNFSKMGEDGQPIYDAENKLQKGPYYWKPEPKIATLLQSLIASRK